MKRFILPLLLVAACASPPRVSTPEERATAESYLFDAETLLIAAHEKNYLSDKEFADGEAAIAAIRMEVARSETAPVQWDALLRRALLLSLAWVPEKK